MFKKFIFTVGYASAVLLISCSHPPKKSNGEEKLSPDIVSNPASATGKADSSMLPEFEFENTTHHFGEITAGEKVSYTFKFKNTGGSDLVIANASASCGCTVPEYTKAAVHPGDNGEIKVTFDSNGKSGMVSKTVTVLANTMPATKVLTISAEIIQPEKK